MLGGTLPETAVHMEYTFQKKIWGTSFRLYKPYCCRCYSCDLHQKARAADQGWTLQKQPHLCVGIHDYSVELIRCRAN